MTIPVETVMVDKQDFDRLEDKVDTITSALGKLILFEERQSEMGKRMGEIEKAAAANYNELAVKVQANKEAAQKEIARIDGTVSKWTNMILGGWAVVSFLGMLGMGLARFIN
jgi:hypothetical protein